jgi:hypothetical protein
MNQEAHMFDRLKENELYKSLLKKFKVKFEENKKGAADEKDIKKKEVIGQPSYPDAIWHRSKSARFRQN